MRSKYQHHGLTLVELIVAIAVLGLISVLGWRGLDAITRTRLVLNQDLTFTRGLQLAFAQLQVDCANTVDSPLLTGVAPLVINASRVTLVRRVKPESQAGALQVVSWRWQAGALTREEAPPTRDLDQLGRDLQRAYTISSTAITLHSPIQQVVLRVWTDDGRGWRSWQQMQPSQVSRGSLMSPETGTTATQTIWRGLELSLQLPNQTASMTKVFLLGSV